MRAEGIRSFWDLHHLDLSPREGFRFGSPDTGVTGVLVCWLPTIEAIQSARAQGCNLIVARDRFAFPPEYGGARIEHNMSDTITLRRMRELARAGIVVFRACESVDELMLDSFARDLGLPEPLLCGDRVHRVYHVTSIPARRMVEQIRQRMAVDSPRVCGDLDRVVRRVALLWGNVGSAHNPDGLEPVLALKPDLLIAGDVDEYSMRAALDAGVPIVLVGHARSLTPGLKRLVAMLRGQFPGLRVVYYENPCPWVPL